MNFECMKTSNLEFLVLRCFKLLNYFSKLVIVWSQVVSAVCMQIGITFLQFNNSCPGLDKTTFDGLGFGGWNQGNWGIFNCYTCLDNEDIRSSTNMIPPPLFRRDVITNIQLCNLLSSFLKYYVLESQDASPPCLFCSSR